MGQRRDFDKRKTPVFQEVLNDETPRAILPCRPVHLDSGDGGGVFPQSIIAVDSAAQSFDAAVPDAQLAMSSAEYPVTAGDVYTLAFAAGTQSVTYAIPVDASYKIQIANLGVLDCAGLTYLELKERIINLVHRNYPMGGAQFVLTAPASFLVTITGEVKATVQKRAWALTRLSSLCKPEFTTLSSARNIEVVSEDGSSKVYDLFKAERGGDLSQDPFLRPNDTVTVKRIDRKVTIKGAVERPGVYDLLEGENLKALIEDYSGGLLPTADLSRTELLRVAEAGSPGEKRYLTARDVEADFALLCYDKITIADYEDLKPVFFLEGAIQQTLEDGTTSVNPDASSRISAEFNSGEDYASFLRRNKTWFSPISDLANAYIIREGQRIPINLNALLYDASVYAGVQIEPYDVLIVPFRQYFVSVSGSVRNPGRYPFIPDRNWEYYVGLAGGIIKSQNARESVEITDVNGNALSKTDSVTPETNISVKTNSALYYFNQYAPVLTMVLSVISTSISILAISGVL